MTCALVPEPLEQLARNCGATVRRTELDLTPSDAHGFVAKARLEVDDETGTVVVRAHVASATSDAAVDHVCGRVREQLDARLTEPIASGSSAVRRRWSFGAPPAHRPCYVDKPALERSIVRTKRYHVAELAPEQAIRAAALRDVDFHVFLRAGNGQPAVVRRGDRNDWELVEPARCQLDDAIEMLDISHARFVCFVAAPVPGVHAVYRRFDGDYALLSPA
jgi:hypothetical protein